MDDSQQYEKAGDCYRFPKRTLLRLTGGDRQKWLNNFCTADIKAFEPGMGCEAFILNVKGRTIAHAIVVASKYDLTVIAMGEPEISLIDHFNKYIITEDVQVEDIGGNHELWYAKGDRLNLMFESAIKSADLYGHGLVRDRTIAVSAEISTRCDWLLLVEKTEDVSQWYGGLNELTADEFDQLRFASRFPINGIDVTLDHLPQEFCRDDEAISFKKGCYLGQETVARIDALGHVNYFFVNLQFADGVATPGLEIKRDDKVVGKVTSAAENKGLGFVRRLMAKHGEEFQSDAGSVSVA